MSEHPSISAVLARELGAGAVIGAGDPQLADYARDETAPAFAVEERPPECAVLCTSTEQVAAVLRICLERGVPVTPRGAGSGMCGGALPLHGGVVLSTEKMARIKEIDPGEFAAFVVQLAGFSGISGQIMNLDSRVVM